MSEAARLLLQKRIGLLEGAMHAASAMLRAGQAREAERVLVAALYGGER